MNMKNIFKMIMGGGVNFNMLSPMVTSAQIINATLPDQPITTPTVSQGNRQHGSSIPFHQPYCFRYLLLTI